MKKERILSGHLFLDPVSDPLQLFQLRLELLNSGVRAGGIRTLWPFPLLFYHPKGEERGAENGAKQGKRKIWFARGRENLHACDTARLYRSIGEQVRKRHQQTAKIQQQQFQQPQLRFLEPKKTSTFNFSSRMSISCLPPPLARPCLSRSCWRHPGPRIPARPRTVRRSRCPAKEIPRHWRCHCCLATAYAPHR